MNNLYEFIIKARDEASSTFKSVQKSFNTMAEDFNTKNKAMIDQSKKFALGLGVAGVAAAGLATKLAMEAGQNQRTQITFKSLGETIGLTTESMDSMRKATNGLVSDVDLMASGNKLISMGLAQSEEEMAKVMKTATRLGQAMGTGPTQSMEDFALMLANQSIPRLDTFGISSGKVRERIEELMKANEGMTRETAFMTATMEEAEKTLGKLGEFTPTATEKFEQMQVQLANVSQKFGELLIPMVDALIPLLQHLANAIEFMISFDWSAWIQENQIALGALAGVLVSLVTPAIVSFTTTSIASAVAFIAAWWPVIAIGAAIGAAAVALKVAWEENFLGIRDISNQVWQTLQNVWAWMETNIVPTLQSIAEGAAAVWSWMAQVAEENAWLIDGAFKVMGTLLEITFTTIKDYITLVWTNIQTFFGIILDLISGDFGAAWEGMKTLLSGLLEQMFFSVTSVWQGIKIFLDNMFGGLGTSIENFVGGFLATIGSWLTSAWDMITSTWNAILGFFAGIWQSITWGVTEGVSNVMAAIESLMTQITDIMVNLPILALDWGKNMVFGFAEGIAAAAGAAVDAAKNMASSAAGAVTGFLGIQSPSRLFIEYGKFTGEGLAQGLKESMSNVQAASLDMAGSVAAPTQELSRASSGAGGISQSNNTQNNSTVINISARDGQSAGEIAREVERLLTRKLQLTQVGAIR